MLRPRHQLEGKLLYLTPTLTSGPECPESLPPRVRVSNLGPPLPLLPTHQNGTTIDYSAIEGNIDTTCRSVLALAEASLSTVP